MIRLRPCVGVQVTSFTPHPNLPKQFVRNNPITYLHPTKKLQYFRRPIEMIQKCKYHS